MGDRLDGDLHDFVITENGTALITVYDIKPADLTLLGGPKSGWIYDGVFQEIDIETGKLLFEWRAAEHYNVNETFAPLGSTGRESGDAFDFFHINSVDKDSDGSYLISSRYMHTVTCISPSGEIKWVLGGSRNNFRDLSDGGATNFTWQHHARWHENNTVTIFDNGAFEMHDRRHYTADYSRGMLVDLDVAQMTATLRHSYIDPQNTISPSQGSIQILPENGNVFVGWGHSPAYTEFSVDGEVLCDTHFGPSSLFDLGIVKSYRAFKSPWVGRPTTMPDIKMSGGKVYVSWNGATDVAFWELQAAENLEVDQQDFQPVDSVEKIGFESSIAVPADNGLYLHVAAVNAAGKVLGYTDVIDASTGQSATHPPESEVSSWPVSSWVINFLGAFIGVLLIVKIFWKPLSRFVGPYRGFRYSILSVNDDTISSRRFGRAVFHRKNSQ